MNKAKHNKKERQRKNIEDEAKKTYSLSSKINALMKNIKKTHSLRQITSFMKIFRSVLNDENEEKIVIDEGDLFNEIMQFSLTHLPDILKNILNLVFLSLFLIHFIF